MLESIRLRWRLRCRIEGLVQLSSEQGAQLSPVWVPAAFCARCLHSAIQLVQRSPGLVKKLWDNTRYFKKGLKDLGFDTGNSETPITPVMVGESGKARKLADSMFKLGVFVLPIVYPMVAKDKARIRTIVTSA